MRLDHTTIEAHPDSRPLTTYLVVVCDQILQLPHQCPAVTIKSNASHGIYFMGNNHISPHTRAASLKQLISASRPPINPFISIQPTAVRGQRIRPPQPHILIHYSIESCSAIRQYIGMVRCFHLPPRRDNCIN